MALVMFDLDGTLLDTADEITEAVNRTLGEFNRSPVSHEDVRRWIGYGTGWLMEQAWTASSRGKPDHDRSRVMARFVDHYYECSGTTSRVYPFVLEALEALKALGVKRAIVTNKERRFTDRILLRHGLADTFDMVVAGDTLKVKKPDPAVLFHCMDSLGQAAGESLFVGDSEIDVATARAAGVTCWAVPYGYNMGQPIESAGPDLVVPNVKDVPNYFKGFA